jgi:hypothetical protein
VTQLLQFGRAALAAGLIAAVGGCVAPAADRPAPGDADFEQLVRGYYGALNERRHADAYASLSRAAREREPYAEFERQLEPIVTVEARSVEGVAAGAATASLVARVATVSKGQVPGMGTCSRVAWRLVLEDGGWKRDSASPANEECPEDEPGRR